MEYFKDTSTAYAIKLGEVMSHRRGKRTSVRRVLTVIEVEHQYYVVVLDEVKDIYKIRTAFPATKSYYERCIRGQGTNAGMWG